MKNTNVKLILVIANGQTIVYVVHLGDTVQNASNLIANMACMNKNIQNYDPTKLKLVRSSNGNMLHKQASLFDVSLMEGETLELKYE